MARPKKSDSAPFITDDPPAQSNVTGLRKYLDRVERVEEEIDALKSDLKEIWTELKNEGYNVSMAKKAYLLSKMAREKRLVLGQYADSLSLFE